jgi:long-chain acyl-CoA synthetase
LAHPTLADLIRRVAGAHPGATALTFPGGSLTYGEVDARSNRVANALAAAGVGPGDRVALLARNGPLFFDVLFGAAKLNAVAAGINWRLSPAEIGVLLDDVDARLLLVDEGCADQLRAVEQLRRDREQAVVFGPDGTHPGPDDWAAPFPASDPRVKAEPGDVALLVYTSGTTGDPHGVEISHAALSFLLPRAARTYRFDPTAVNLAAMPFFHISGPACTRAAGWSSGRGPSPAGCWRRSSPKA